MKGQPLEQRLADKRVVDDDTGCWLWQGDKRNGYGSVWRGGVRCYAHRVAYELTHGPIPAEMHVCHRCDRPACVNPDHLFVGSQADNIRDMWSKGRGSRPPLHHGASHPQAKLSDADVVAVRARCAAGETQTKVAADYGVSQTAVSAICRGVIRRGAVA